MAKVLKGEVDFYINYSVTTDEKVDISQYNTYAGHTSLFSFSPVGPYGYADGMVDPYGYPSVYGEAITISNKPTGKATETTEYKEGTLVIDVLDPKTDKLLWRGVSNGKLPKIISAEGREAGVKKVVEKILARFPPEGIQPGYK